MKLIDAIDINPKETVKKGEIAKKIPMDKLQPFCRDIPEFELSEFSGGTKFKNGDTIMARITPCLENGKTAMVNILNDNEVGFGSTEFIVFRAKEGITNPYYVYYLISSPTVRDIAIKSMVGSSGRQRVQTDVVKNIELNLPDYDTQTKIASVLKSFDDKIAINSAINDNLAQQLTLVVDEFINDLYEYDLRILSDIADCQNGYAFYKDGYDDNGAFVIDLGNVNTSATFVYTNADKYISLERYNQKKLEKFRVYKNDLVMVMTDRKSTMELLGKTGKIYKDGLYLLNQRMFRIRAKEDININYLYAVLNSSSTCNALKEQALGSVQKYINTGTIKNIKIKVPSHSKMEELSCIVDPISSTIENNTIENEKLIQLRDSLLPKLMSGEIDVSNIKI